ncbi:MAG: CIA30 family protein [Polaribacter sp.]|jgi:NADH dehydrogenase [ubiquinone] 1 alpha subcomplex assembly factor 1|nr:CIA30 family protein [Polaribacter sp.]MDG1954453.1 CIA30 family protein [Polaribacter sp.]MDG2073439.1 CIA30 family protein [Polaribacter sp.]
MFILRVVLIFSMINNSLVFDFKKESNISNWVILDDVVMGGKSYGNFYLNKNGHGEFYGDVSLENNGGFSSVRYRFNKEKTNVFSKFIIRVKGDGKAYQFRVKNSKNDYHSYIYSFQTTKDWQTIEIPFAEMYPAFRGRKLNIENYQGEKMQEIAFLIGNKKNENFRLEIDKIEIQ